MGPLSACLVALCAAGDAHAYDGGAEWTTISIADPRDNGTSFLFHYSVHNASLIEYGGGNHTPWFNFEVYGDDGHVRLRMPKNYPYEELYNERYPEHFPVVIVGTDPAGNHVWDYVGYLDNTRLVPNDCFHDIDVTSGNLTRVDIAISVIIANLGKFNPAHVLQRCLPQTMDPLPAHYGLSFKEQVAMGVNPSDILCEGEMRAAERPGGDVACVYPDTARRLGWDVLLPP